MDNLTHSLVGVALSRAGLNRLIPQAGWLLVAAANAPDLDAVTGVSGNTAYLDYHRGWTHAFAGAPLVALAPLALWWLLVRRRRPGVRLWGLAYLVSLVGVLSHAALDWLNVYGIRLGLPWSGAWFRADLVHIVDVWVWGILLVSVAAPALSRLVHMEIGARARPGRGAAWLSLVLLCAYVLVRAQLHGDAVATLNSRLHLGQVPARVAAFPSPLKPWEWTGLVETEEFYRVYTVNLRGEFDPEQGRTLYKAKASQAIEAAKETHAARSFLRFAQYPMWRVIPADRRGGGLDVLLTDLRFGMPEDRRFLVTVELDATQRPGAAGMVFGALQPR